MNRFKDLCCVYRKQMIRIFIPQIACSVPTDDEQIANTAMINLLGASRVYVPKTYRLSMFLLDQYIIFRKNPEALLFELKAAVSLLLRLYQNANPSVSPLQLIQDWSFLVENAMYIPNVHSAIFTFEIKPKWGSLPVYFPFICFIESSHPSFRNGSLSFLHPTIPKTSHRQNFLPFLLLPFAAFFFSNWAVSIDASSL